MEVILQHNNTRHIALHFHGPIWFTKCGIKVALVGAKCPDKPTHRIIFPNCILHTKPVRCNECLP